MRLEAAGEKAIQHSVREKPNETNDNRRIATDRVARARPLAGNRVRNDSTCLRGRHCLGDTRLKHQLTSQDKADLNSITLSTPAWMRPILREISKPL
jgi:hypothetical protein